MKLVRTGCVRTPAVWDWTQKPRCASLAVVDAVGTPDASLAVVGAVGTPDESAKESSYFHVHGSHSFVSLAWSFLSPCFGCLCSHVEFVLAWLLHLFYPHVTVSRLLTDVSTKLFQTLQTNYGHWKMKQSQIYLCVFLFITWSGKEISSLRIAAVTIWMIRNRHQQNTVVADITNTWQDFLCEISVARHIWAFGNFSEMSFVDPKAIRFHGVRTTDLITTECLRN